MPGGGNEEKTPGRSGDISPPIKGDDFRKKFIQEELRSEIGLWPSQYVRRNSYIEGRPARKSYVRTKYLCR